MNKNLLFGLIFITGIVFIAYELNKKTVTGYTFSTSSPSYSGSGSSLPDLGSPSILSNLTNWGGSPSSSGSGLPASTGTGTPTYSSGLVSPYSTSGLSSSGSSSGSPSPSGSGLSSSSGSTMPAGYTLLYGYYYYSGLTKPTWSPINSSGYTWQQFNQGSLGVASPFIQSGGTYSYNKNIGMNTFYALRLPPATFI